MNPHDPTEQPGSHFVAGIVGTEPEHIAQQHPRDSPHSLLARMLNVAAREVDELHRLLTQRANDVIHAVQPFALGQRSDLTLANGILQNAGHDIDLLAARRGAAHRHLVQLVSAYRRLPPEPGVEASTGPEQSRENAADREAPFDSDWVVAGDRQTNALLAVEKGGLRLKQSAFAEQDAYLSDGTGVMVHIWPETVQRMIADGLLDLDSSTTPAQGQLLSLTPQGRQALRATDHAATPQAPGPGDAAAAAQDRRTIAARNRSSVPSTRPGPAPESPASGAPDTPKSTRSR